ncbi:hypothetical protein B4589_002060 [Halolamina sp. CBA1230]|uniref:DUF5789 family protein n=1 Tax=Halolamina sp. CBA1230 TaxID=1853690 RepID=UPI0009A173E2|nr:hypothetical protein [Halolamina sp. CBA1230]QKY19216.1 hypothetical protein B4589_002060 [Halolamina sp. CBA1230]
MPLKPADARELFVRECSFPMDQEAVVETVGNVAIESMNGDESDIETVLARSSETTYSSVEQLHNALMANLGDEHIGRKYYDDRSSVTTRSTELSF